MARKLAVLIGISLGAAISLYLALYELGALTSVWDPIFGSGSQRVLHSPFSRSLPVPDALLGFVAYLIELGLDWIKDFTSLGKRSWPAILLGIVATPMALAGIFLTSVQIFIVHSGCSLCLGSASLSLLIFGPCVSEARAAWRGVRERVKNGAAWQDAITAPGGTTAAKD